MWVVHPLSFGILIDIVLYSYCNSLKCMCIAVDCISDAETNKSLGPSISAI